jgi:hypothetical protein
MAVLEDAGGAVTNPATTQVGATPISSVVTKGGLEDSNAVMTRE